MTALLQQLGSAVTGLVYSLWHLLSFPFSRASRWRSLRLLSVCLDPFVLERIPLSRLLPEPFVISVGPLKSLDHNTSEYELVCLAALVKTSGAGQVFEIGTYDGRSSRAMAMNLPEQGRLFTLNLPPGQDANEAGERTGDSVLNVKVVSGQRFLATPEAARIEQIFGDSATFDFGPFEGRMDLVFIDGSHTRAYAESDTAIARRLVKASGGWVVWHDATLYGVAPYLRQQITGQGWPLRLIDGTTLMVGYCREGQMVDLPLTDR
jgi:predicted O-methyltransferase YrrM